MRPPRLEIAPGCFTDAPDNVVPITSKSAEDKAWESYSEMARKVAADPSLLFDREFREELARRDDKWRRIFLMRDGGGQ